MDTFHRVQTTVNLASNRYSREIILSKFSRNNLFLGIVPDEALSLYLHTSSDPCGYHSTQTPFPEAENSRSSPKKREDYLESPKKRSAKTPKKPPSFKPEVQPSAMTPKASLRPEQGSKNEETVCMVPVFEKKLLLEYVQKGNPFANAMIRIGLDGGDDDKIYLPLGLGPYKPVWYYRDPAGSVQGPFSSIAMFNWTLRKIFPDDLEISFGQTEFVPMNQYLNPERVEEVKSGKV
jgi:hypothetical protein